MVQKRLWLLMVHRHCANCGMEPATLKSSSRGFTFKLSACDGIVQVGHITVWCFRGEISIVLASILGSGALVAVRGELGSSKAIFC